MIITIGDLHIKENKSYKKASYSFLNYLIKNYKGENLIFTGDFFNDSKPNNITVYEVLGSLKNFKSVHILTGNHEINEIGVRKGNPLIPLFHIENFHIYTEPKEVHIEGLKFLMLPYLYNVKGMKEQYEKIETEVDYVISHVSYPGTNFGNIDEVNLRKIKATRFFYGHIHEPNNFDDHIILGVPVSTRYGEHLWKKQIGIIKDNKEFYLKEIPHFLQFEEIKFGEEPKDINSILCIYDAPSVSSVKKKYKEFQIQKIELIGDKDFKDVKLERIDDSLVSNFQSFLKESKEEIRKPVIDYISSVLV